MTDNTDNMNPRQLAIVTEAARLYNVKVSEVVATGRNSNASASARQMCYLIFRSVLNTSAIHIGYIFDRDITTVYEALKQLKVRLNDPTSEKNLKLIENTDKLRVFAERN